MFIDFSIENYRSIAEKQTISFVASKHRSKAQGQAAMAAEGLRAQKLLTSAVIYGANASGKSNVVRALAEFSGRIRTSATEPEHDIQPFRLNPKWAGKPSRFELSFLLEGTRYQYGFAVDAERVHEEWLVPSRVGCGGTRALVPRSAGD
jgi:AAA15 family ATPase/GTPase